MLRLRQIGHSSARLQCSVPPSWQGNLETCIVLAIGPFVKGYLDSHYESYAGSSIRSHLNMS